MTDPKAVVEIRGLSKSFPGVQALADVDFTLRQGEIHGLMGENGAGKSTLIKLLTGVYKKDQGTIYLEGKEFECQSPMDAPKHGISTVYQEINLIPELSVAENIYLGRQPMKLGFIDWNAMNRGATAALERLDVMVDVTFPVSFYSIAIQQLVAIARALDISAKILIFDEPTSSLDTAEVAHLFTVLRKLKETGIGIIFITHFIDQVYDIADRITILRNGQLIGTYPAPDLSRMSLITNMLGKEWEEFDTTSMADKGKKTGTKQEPFINVSALERRGFVAAFDLEINRGEVIGLAGLLGSGRTEIARLLFGIDKPHSGHIQLKGNAINISSPRKAIEQFFGFCPEDRKVEGIIAELTVRENIILALQARRGIFKTLSRKKQDEIVEKYIKALNIVTPSPEQVITNLSGGNQQKVILARWLASNPEFLILDEPTRGIDIGAKAEIQKMILTLSGQGIAILFISSELEEVIRCSHRVVVLRDRKKIGELEGTEIEQNRILSVIAGEGNDGQ